MSGARPETDPVVFAEQAVLGAMLTAPSAIDEVLSVIGPKDFYRPAHQIIAQCVADMHGAAKRVDPLTVGDELGKRRQITKTGGAPYLHTVFAAVPVAASAGYYAGIVREYADRRQLVEIATRITQAAQDGASPADVIARALGALESLSRGTDKAAAEPTELRGIPAYPADKLIGPLASLVSSSTLPAALVGGAGLGALAGICGNADLMMPDGSRVRPVLWLALMAPRGSGKTPAMDVAFRRLRELDALEYEQYRNELSDYTGKSPKERDSSTIPRDQTRRIDDATLEVVARFLDHGDGTGVVEVDELSGWLQSMGQYKRVSGDKGRWLSMWSATPWRYTRVGADKSGLPGVDLYIQRPVLSVVGGVQPHLHNLLGDADSGFRPRWLLHSAPLESVEWGDRVHPAAEWDSAIDKLYHLRERRDWMLEGDALRLWRARSAAWKGQARGTENVGTSAALDKSDVQAARIALVIAESLDPGAGGPVPVEAMECAIAITDYVMDCWRALPGEEAFALSRKDEILSKKVDELANWLETRKDRRATRTQVKEAHIGGVRTADEVETLLRSYAKVYPGTVVQEKPAGGGRPGQVVYAPARKSLSVTTGVTSPGTRVSDRSETQGTYVDTPGGVKPQVARSEIVSGHVVGNSLVGNSLVGNSAPESDETTPCAVCTDPLYPGLVKAGITVHPGCAPEASETVQ
jgi:hypothetical protein